MKTNRIIFMLALAAAATACNKAELEGTDPAGLKSNQFLASLEGASTKVTMADDFSLSWVAGDQVSVFGEDLKNNLFTADAAGEEVALNGGEVTVDPEATYYAIYPYSEKNSIVAGGVITTEIPTVQTPKQGDIPVNFAVARNDGQTFTFYNVCGLVGFEITEEDIVSVTIKANGAEEYLTGKINVTPSTAPSYEVVEGVSEVTLVTDGVFEKGYHYVAVLPQAFENGITVLMAKEDGTVATKTTTKSFTLNRSHRIDTKQIDADQSWTKLTSISNAAELQAFLAAADNYAAADVVTLAADIDLKGYDIVPAASFAGTFDGASKSIKNWNTTTALFNEVSGTVKDLTIAESCNLEVQQQGDAAFVALSNTGTISGCTNKGIVTSVNEAFVSDVAEVHNDRAIGTIAAVSTGRIVSCVNEGTITIAPESVSTYALQYIGGVAGKASATADVNALESCTNNGAVTFDGPFSSKLFIGGVCGGTPAGAGTFGDYGVFKTLKNVADVTLTVPTASSIASTYINLGGVIGYAEADLDDCDNEGAVSVELTSEPASASHAYQRPSIAGVAGTVLYNVANCDNAGSINVTGAFTSGSENSIGAGQYNASSIAGVVALAGCEGNTVSGCNNTGALTLDLNAHRASKSNIYLGGVVGYTLAAVTSCVNEGAMNVDNSMRAGYVGGIVGRTSAQISSCTNKAAIDYDLKLTEADGDYKATGLYLGGIVGQYDSSSDIASTNNALGGNITVSNGFNSGNPYYIGGIAGVTKGRMSQGANKKYQQFGTITVNSAGCVIVGGLAGTSGKSFIDMQLSDVVINVTNPGVGSRIGGICGVKTATNDARLSAEVSINVSCASQTDDVYTGHFYGEMTAGWTIHTTVINGTVTTSNTPKCGIIAGLYNAESGKVTLGNTISSNKYRLLKLRPGNKYDGVTVTTDNWENLFFGSKLEGSTVTVSTTNCQIATGIVDGAVE